MNEKIFFELVRAPGRETYRKAWQALIESPAYDPYSEEIYDIVDLIEAERYDEAQEALRAAMPNLHLSPSAHLMMSRIARGRGEEQTSEIEMTIAAACAEGLKATGDGSREQPYLVARTTDEYDLLGYLEKEMAEQSLVHADERHFDLIKTADGAEIWFDITVPYGILQQRRQDS